MSLIKNAAQDKKMMVQSILFLLLAGVLLGTPVFVASEEEAIESEDEVTIEEGAERGGEGEGESEAETTEEPYASTTVEMLAYDIQQRNDEIAVLEEEITAFQAEVEEKQEEGRTLKGELKRIDNDLWRIRNDVAITEKKLDKTELEIEAFDIEIAAKEDTSYKIQKGLASLMQAFFERDQESLLVVLLKHELLSNFFQELDSLSILKENMVISLKALRDLREDLGIQKAEAQGKKQDLRVLGTNLRYQKNLQTETRGEKKELLDITENEEQKFQDLVAEREARRAALEQEIREIEGKIQVTIDPASLPPKRSGTLASPLPETNLRSCWRGADGNCVTQYFGKTSFARRGAYNGQGHNGVDFRAKTGDRVVAASGGVVEAIGDTDKGCRGASYGKWILLRHPNNLSTLYAHLSRVSVDKGEQVERNEHIGYSGRTGYATGPHLHFSVFATKGVEVTSIRSKVCGRLMTLPVGATNGYLDPLDYL